MADEKLDFRSFMIRACVYPPGLRQTRHSHDHNNVTIITDGRIEEATEGGQYCGSASSVVLKSAGCEHETRISGFGARTLTIEFSRTSPLARAVDRQTWWWSEATDVVRRALALQRAFSRRSRGDVERLAIDLVATVVSANEARHAGGPAWIAAIKARLDENFERPPRFEDLARDLGLHPVYVSRAFHRYVGTSMTDY